MKKLLTIALLGSLFAGQAFAKTATFKPVKYQIPKINKKALMATKKKAESQAKMYQSDMDKAQTQITRYAKKADRQELAKARATFRAAVAKRRQAINQIAEAAEKLK